MTVCAESREKSAVRKSDLASILQVYNDVTERLKRSHESLMGEVRRLRVELNEKNRELQRRERLAALGEMAAGLAHEIRSPLGGIGLYASLLERDLCSHPEQQDIARRIGEGVDNLESIIRDVLAFAGGGGMRREIVPLAEIVESVVSQARPRTEASRVMMEIGRETEDYCLDCDVGHMERALTNLVFNALEACGFGGRVWIGARSASGLEKAPGPVSCVSILVQDNGPGIDPKVADRIFNPFFTTKDTGTGLGLAIVHGIAEAHGGKITVGARPGGGASMVLTVPGQRCERLTSVSDRGQRRLVGQRR